MARGTPESKARRRDEVLEGMRLGLTQVQIGRRFAMSRAAVQWHMGQLYLEGVVGRTEGGRWFIKDEPDELYEVKAVWQVRAPNEGEAWARALRKADPRSVTAEALTGPDETLKVLVEWKEPA